MYSQKDFEFSVYSEKIRELLGDIEENNKNVDNNISELQG